MRRLANLVPLLILLAGCELPPTVTPTRAALPTEVATYVIPTTPTATATPTPTATATPLVCLCPTGDLVIRCVMGETQALTPCHVELVYDGLLPPDAVTQYDITATTGIIALGVTPGAWTLLVRDSPQLWVDNPPAYVWLTAGNTHLVTLSFYSNPTPVATRTATVTATPAPYACPNYAVNCMIACSAGRVVDPRGQCGTNFLCCPPVTPTRAP